MECNIKAFLGKDLFPSVTVTLFYMQTKVKTLRTLLVDTYQHSVRKIK